MTKRKALGSGLEALLSSKLDKKAEKEINDFGEPGDQFWRPSLHFFGVPGDSAPGRLGSVLAGPS